MTRKTTRRKARKTTHATPRKIQAAEGSPSEKREKRVFWVRLDVQIEIDEDLLREVLTEEWRQQFYPLVHAKDVAGHLAFNLAQGRDLQSLDGFADQEHDRARILEIEFDEGDIEEERRP